MQVILLSDVAKVGKKYSVVNVAPGYARNFLFPKGLAEAVTKQNARKVADMQAKRAAEEKRQEDMLAKAIAGMKAVELSFARKANEEGHLYAGVSREEIADALGKELGVAIAASHLHVEHTIKSVGDHKVTVKIGDKEAEVKVTVTEEN